jgi:N-acetylmuramoyl-L-alanine amidase
MGASHAPDDEVLRMNPRRIGSAVLPALLLLCGGPTAAGAQTRPAEPQPVCDRAAFRTVVDVGHTADVPGASSARGATEYDFNLRLAQQINKDLRAAGFGRTVLMVSTEPPTAGLYKRAARINDLKADLLLSVHHDAVPDSFLETWQFEGQEQHFNDRFPGHSLFISNDNADPRGSLAFGRLLGNALKARGLRYTPHYTEKFMGNRRRELVDAQAGVYRYDQLIVLKHTRMPAVLLEAGSIVNRDEELLLATPERHALVGAAVVEAVDAFCAARRPLKPTPAAAAEKKKT